LVYSRRPGPAPGGLDRLHDAMAVRIANRELPGMVLLVARGAEVRL